MTSSPLLFYHLLKLSALAFLPVTVLGLCCPTAPRPSMGALQALGLVGGLSIMSSIAVVEQNVRLCPCLVVWPGHFSMPSFWNLIYTIKYQPVTVQIV
jgi:hypothetical protein